MGTNWWGLRWRLQKKQKQKARCIIVHCSLINTEKNSSNFNLAHSFYVVRHSFHNFWLKVRADLRPMMKWKMQCATCNVQNVKSKIIAIGIEHHWLLTILQNFLQPMVFHVLLFIIGRPWRSSFSKTEARKNLKIKKFFFITF